MKKIMNDAVNYVDETLEGLEAAHPDVFRIDGETRRLLRKPTASVDRVGVVSGGGFGHLPIFAGYVGDGLLDACAVGDVFASPDMNPMLEAIKSADAGKGVLCVVGNYGGDKMNFAMACEFADMEDITTQQIIVNDDVASAGVDEIEKRRGVAGLVYVVKVAGAAAQAGKSLDEVYACADRARQNTRTMGVALGSCIVPQAGKVTFEIADDEIEIGMGIHGEPGVWRGKNKPADELAAELLHKLTDELDLLKGDRVSVLVNGLGATPAEELYILFRAVNRILSDKGIEIVQPLVGNYATSMEMAGASISLMKLDDELEQLLAAPAKNPFWGK
ncbi:dihydroxyacetone kinase DhaK subunit [Epibacterium ulvae]|uniref:Dihydroxyacetone kinase DhaK subunit n=1 Tax=Epibacterium ulvae TaxID=1156985 RepID=A0A1G5R0B3_9RHOB|nr:dihydroxyacetone kinase subunit DhaK [Epibacterium ulvae]SCZ67260.1 dihydroxyacetone kinase DhaK subunit [Epibacterium ulvae]